jgi:hypothetical protein
MPDFLAEALTQPRNYHIRLALRAAMAAKTKPSNLLLTGQEKLNKLFIRKLDAAMWMAAQVLKDETCPNCGIVHWHGQNEDNNIQFEDREVVCYSCQQKAAEDRKRSKDEKNHEGDGVTHYLEVVPAMKSQPLPGRAEYQERLYKARLAELEKEMSQG